MSKVTLAIIILVVAAASAGATVGIMKYIESGGGSGKITILSDKRCKDCNPERLQTTIKGMFPNEEIEIVDYGDRSGKKLYEKEKIDMLPAVLLPKRLEKSENYTKVQKFATPGVKYITLRTGGKFDPKAEICDNKIDDNGDLKVDCDDPSCKSNWLCMEKREKPDVDVFVMSHCPFGTQIEKGLLPVWDAIGDKINLNIRFCDYAMHGKKEVDEQVRQYCIQNIDKKKFRKYLECFLKEGKTDDTCLNEAKINKGELASCVKGADKTFKVTEKFNDKSTWKGRFPSFPIDAELAQKYGVRGSPTLIINEVRANAGRSPKALMEAICTGFKDRPAECDVEIDTENPSPGFGFKKGGGGSTASCGS